MKTIPTSGEGRQSVTYFNERLPIPTPQNPHTQLDWIFNDKVSLYSKQASRENYSTALVFYKRFLKHTHNYSAVLEKDPRFFLAREWDVFALRKVLNWIEATNIAGTDDYRSSYSITSIVSALRQTMAHAYEHSHIEKPVINVPMPDAVRETTSRTAYSLSEYEQIFKVVDPMIRFSKSLLQPYIPTGKGKDPRTPDKRTVKPGKKRIGEGWSCGAINEDNLITPQDDNLRWYFENVMNCIPLAAVPENRIHQRFFVAAARTQGGLRALYQKWGVAYAIDAGVIMPLLVELTAETGLNVESVVINANRASEFFFPISDSRLPYLRLNAFVISLLTANIATSLPHNRFE